MDDTVAVGTVLARRYRLDQRMAVYDGAEAWKARDTVLGRDVHVHLIPVDDPRSQRLAEAARAAAAVPDPRFLRVLDAAVYDGSGYVVREWVRGRSLSAVLVDGPLSPTSAGVLGRELAGAVAAAHAAGVHHLRLSPAMVIVADDGAVKITGLGTEAALHGIAVTDEEAAAAQDAAGIGRVLYAALTGRWPGVGTDLPPAPTVDGRAARPRQVRAGVPGELDDVVDRTLNPAPRHETPLRTPRAVADALAAAVPANGRGSAYLLDVSMDPESTQPGAAGAPLVALAARPAAPGPPARPAARRPDREPRRSRSAARIVGVVAGALLLVGATLVGWQLLTSAFPNIGGGPPVAPSAPAPVTSASRSGSPSAASQELTIAGAADFDPYGDPPSENPDRVGRAIDGDPSTAWTTMTYYDPLEVLKPGVGLFVDLGKATRVGSVQLTLRGSPSDVQVRVAPQDAPEPPKALSGWAEVASRSDAGEQVTLTLKAPVQTRYVLVWFTKLPPVGGDYKGEVAEVVVRS